MGPTPKELDSFNELIQFDHVYYKSLPQPKSAPQMPVTPIQTIRIKKDNTKSICNNTSVTNNVQKVTENGCKNVKIIITSDPANAKNVKVDNEFTSEKVLTIPNVFIDTEALQRVSKQKNIETASQNMLFEAPTELAVNSTSHITDDTSSEDLMDLNFDLLEDLENIISADFEGLSSADDFTLHQQDNSIVPVLDPVKSKDSDLDSGYSRKRKVPESKSDSSLEFTDSVPSPTKSFFSLTDSDYMSDTPSPYSSKGISSPLGDTDSSLGDNLWEESFTELFPDLL